MYELSHTPIPELQARAELLHERERQALRAMGVALLRGLPGAAARAELRRVREELEAVASAARLQELRFHHSPDLEASLNPLDKVAV